MVFASAPLALLEDIFAFSSFDFSKSNFSFTISAKSESENQFLLGFSGLCFSFFSQSLGFAVEKIKNYQCSIYDKKKKSFYTLTSEFSYLTNLIIVLICGEQFAPKASFFAIPCYVLCLLVFQVIAWNYVVFPFNFWRVEPYHQGMAFMFPGPLLRVTFFVLCFAHLKLK